MIVKHILDGDFAEYKVCDNCGEHTTIIPFEKKNKNKIGTLEVNTTIKHFCNKCCNDPTYPDNIFLKIEWMLNKD